MPEVHNGFNVKSKISTFTLVVMLLLKSHRNNEIHKNV